MYAELLFLERRLRRRASWDVAAHDFRTPSYFWGGYSVVWTAGRKIASIGVHARDWVTWHGFALNLSTDLSYFDLMVPCGIDAVTMTSIAPELGPDAPGIDGVSEVVDPRTARRFRLQCTIFTD